MLEVLRDTEKPASLPQEPANYQVASLIHKTKKKKIKRNIDVYLEIEQINTAKREKKIKENQEED